MTGIHEEDKNCARNKTMFSNIDFTDESNNMITRVSMLILLLWMLTMVILCKRICNNGKKTKVWRNTLIHGRAPNRLCETDKGDKLDSTQEYSLIQFA